MLAAIMSTSSGLPTCTGGAASCTSAASALVPVSSRSRCPLAACLQVATTMFASPASPRAAAAEEEGKVFSNPLASHPITADPAAAAMLRAKGGDLEGSPASSSIGSPSRSGGRGSSGSGVGAGAGGSKGSGGDGDGHLRRMTQSLVDILESMSGSVQPLSGGSSKGGRGGLVRASTGIHWQPGIAWAVQGICLCLPPLTQLSEYNAYAPLLATLLATCRCAARRAASALCDDGCAR
jgi:hypothetical protein